MQHVRIEEKKGGGGKKQPARNNQRTNTKNNNNNTSKQQNKQKGTNNNSTQPKQTTRKDELKRANDMIPKHEKADILANTNKNMKPKHEKADILANTNKNMKLANSSDIQNTNKNESKPGQNTQRTNKQGVPKSILKKNQNDNHKTEENISTKSEKDEEKKQAQNIRSNVKGKPEPNKKEPEQRLKQQTSNPLGKTGSVPGPTSSSNVDQGSRPDDKEVEVLLGKDNKVLSEDQIRGESHNKCGGLKSNNSFERILYTTYFERRALVALSLIYIHVYLGGMSDLFVKYFENILKDSFFLMSNRIKQPSIIRHAHFKVVQTI